MNEFSKLTAELATVALVMSGAGIAVGAGTAAADTAPAACEQSGHDTKNDWSTVWITHTYDKYVSASTAAAGTQITYKIVVGTTSIGNPYVNSITDYAPPGFGRPIKSSVTAYHFGRGQQTEDVTAEPNGGGWSVNSTGWFVNSGNPVTANFTYLVPNTVSAGQRVVSGGIGVGGTVGVGTDRPNLTACFTARAANPGEAVLGSLGDSGLGSADNQLSSTGSVTDILTGVLKNLIGS
ncbi:hypothetical protein [Nocardia sp. NPDC005825]|uniref:hypothetical protein n=1 Tax=unclassified Nocardia TaxID=2637762 RepID=UPI00340A24F3